ncbi:RloB family protein [Tessaracoccus caeni]|uniref:RloB family protein n=1 Tax=Tessaracoccus caeni TaxID=3031239 RepID=UPI0023DB574B|nr:RloB family protein [Tessaracoccus caeni]MDF1488039.1 RloB family protein [Tessaracoccus caeni]
MTFRVYSEGTVTELEYINALKRLPEFRDSVAVTIEIARSGGQAVQLVNTARNDKRKSNLDIDQYWCVFDVETPPVPGLVQALQTAYDNGLRVAVSNPCFELWLLLHHEVQRGYLTSADAYRRRRMLDKADDKHIDGESYVGRRSVAVRRAKELRAKHEKDGTSSPGDNPSSTFDQFVEALEQAFVRQR